MAATVQLCKLGLKRRHKSREIDRHDIKASDASVGGHLQKPKKPGRRGPGRRRVVAMGWLLVFVVVGLLLAAVMCLVCRKRRSSARLNSEDNWQAQWSQVSSTTPAGGAVELHQVGVRNPMADDRE